MNNATNNNNNDDDNYDEMPNLSLRSLEDLLAGIAVERDAVYKQYVSCKEKYEKGAAMQALRQHVDYNLVWKIDYAKKQYEKAVRLLDEAHATLHQGILQCRGGKEFERAQRDMANRTSDRETLELMGEDVDQLDLENNPTHARET